MAGHSDALAEFWHPQHRIVTSHFAKFLWSLLFIITVCISALMLLIRIARSVHAKYTKVRDSDMQSADGDGGDRKSVV